MMRTTAVVLSCMALGLAACGEKTAGGVKKSDVPAWEGSTGPAAYSIHTWKVGDQTSWEQQMRSRNQGQNEYSRTPTQP
jgi:ABC-type glycerol-3-phosphate transport system substrate-binding protein